MARQQDDYEIYQVQPQGTATPVPIEEKPKRSGPPIHPLAAALTMILDSLWFVPEGAAIATGVGILGTPVLICLTAVSGFLGVLAIQKFVDRDSFGAAATKALLMGAVAGVPTFVGGTTVGGVLLGWAGLSGLGNLLGGGKKKNQ